VGGAKLVFLKHVMHLRFLEVPFGDQKEENLQQQKKVDFGEPPGLSTGGSEQGKCMTQLIYLLR